MNVIAFYNLKGGVGKTAAAVNVAYLAAASGIPTLLWDLDTQGAASWILGVAADDEIKTKKLLNGKAPLGRQVRPSAYPNLDVIAADAGYRDLDPLLAKTDDCEVLAGLLQPFGETYGLVVLDCPPSFSRLSDNVFRAADAVLVPVIPSPLSRLAFERLTEHFRRERIGRERLLPFFSLVDRRRTLHREWLQSPPPAFEPMLKAEIPYCASVERMSLERAPLACFAPKLAATKAYAALFAAIRDRFEASRARKWRTGSPRPEPRG